MGKKIFEKKNWEIFLFNDPNFCSLPIRRARAPDLSNKFFWINHNIDFNIPKCHTLEINFNVVPIEIYAPICTQN